MALKDLVVYVDQTEDSLERLRLAADLAVRHDSYLTALYAREWSRAQLDRRKAAELGLVSAHSLSTLENDIEAAIAAAADKMRAILDERARTKDAANCSASTARPQLSYRNMRATPISAFRAGGARRARLVITPFRSNFCCNRPAGVIRVRSPSIWVLGQHIAVAWNSSRPAANPLTTPCP